MPFRSVKLLVLNTFVSLKLLIFNCGSLAAHYWKPRSTDDPRECGEIAETKGIHNEVPFNCLQSILRRTNTSASNNMMKNVSLLIILNLLPVTSGVLIVQLVDVDQPTYLG